MTAPKVLVVGCGIAGPVLAILLKRKGYDPIVFEKVRELGNAGASLMLMSNGLKVLNLIGLADAVKAGSRPLTTFWDAHSSGDVLGVSDLPSTFAEKYRQPAVGVRRTALNLDLKQTLLDLHIEVREGWELVDIQENERSVTASFSNGESVTGSFLIGCDGIKSASRRILQRKNGIVEGTPVYTGLTQIAGISETPEALSHTPALRNWFGDGIHVIAYPVSQTSTSWAITQRESREREETWRPCQPDELPAQREAIRKLLGGWDVSVAQMATSAERIIKFGLFDRGELSSNDWFSKRCVLVGDAAHPTSPHLGQGANQALEDCYHLSASLPSLLPGSEESATAVKLLGDDLARLVFKPFAENRQPRTSALVKGARLQGERRTATGREACEMRDEFVREGYANNSAVLAAKYDQLLSGPFQ